ncbi:MAG TPA: hypothetical protein VFC78_10300 [Tepidisphaeraceae bacterium]|nr:hypothetical protein [Tepidisphaeraceae bacterium]
MAATPPDKPDFPPLLPLGFHPHTLPELRLKCVDAFPLSKTRKIVMAGLEAVVEALKKEKIIGRIWVDGSFMTQMVAHEQTA